MAPTPPRPANALSDEDRAELLTEASEEYLEGVLPAAGTLAPGWAEAIQTEKDRRASEAGQSPNL